MNLTDDMVLKFQKGSPLLFEDICAIRSPKLGEVVDVGYANFGKYIQVLMLEKPLVDEDSEMGKLIDELTTFQYFLLICQVDEDVNRIARKRSSFSLAMMWFFPLSQRKLFLAIWTKNA